MEKYKLFGASKNIAKGFLAIIIFFTLSATGILYIPLYILDMKYSDTFLTIYSILANFLIIFIIIRIFKIELEESFKDFIVKIKYYFKEYLKYWIIAYLLMIASNILIQPFIGGMAKNEKAVQGIIQTDPFYALVATVIIAPLLEELIFRFSIRKIIYNDWVFIVLSGLVFGSMHIIGQATCWQDWLFILPYGIPGSVFAYAYVKSKNIFVPIMLHAIHNGFSVSLQILLLFLKLFSEM